MLRNPEKPGAFAQGDSQLHALHQLVEDGSSRAILHAGPTVDGCSDVLAVLVGGRIGMTFFVMLVVNMQLSRTLSRCRRRWSTTRSPC